MPFSLLLLHTPSAAFVCVLCTPPGFCLLSLLYFTARLCVWFYAADSFMRALWFLLFLSFWFRWFMHARRSAALHGRSLPPHTTVRASLCFRVFSPRTHTCAQTPAHAHFSILPAARLPTNLHSAHHRTFCYILLLPLHLRALGWFGSPHTCIGLP